MVFAGTLLVFWGNSRVWIPHLKNTSLGEGATLQRWLPTLAPAFVLGILSALYYALYFKAGFNYADEGNYAQFAFELSRGTSLNDLPVSYGLLWFKAGEVLFRIFEPNFDLVRLIFFACILATTLLVYAALLMTTGKRMFAALLAGICALAPAFPATAFYGFCILLNCVPQLILAQRIETARLRDAALAGAALAVSFQIRPDFGYIFAAPLAVLLLLAAWRGESGRERSVMRFAHLTSAALGAFVLLHIPGLIVAINDGYVGTLIGQYLSYPVMLADYGVRGVKALFGSASVHDSGAGILLQRPRFFGAANSDERLLALLVYLPPIIIIAFAVSAVLRFRRAETSYADAAVSLVVLVSGAAALPHYFFYRPDLSHIANFMPGFTVLAGTLAWRAAVRPGNGVRWIITGTTAFTLALYLWIGLTTPGTGSIAGMMDRTERFDAANSVNVRLNPGEKALLEDLRAIIDANSAPGDAIVCVPYCPGIAFMTGRRLLFREQYVDDGVLLSDPAWLERAIALTREQRPPVVIVMDWAINGTDISRFSRWASPYMQLLESLAREKIDRPGLSIFLL